MTILLGNTVFYHTPKAGGCWMKEALLADPAALVVQTPWDVGHMDRNNLRMLIEDPTSVESFSMWRPGHSLPEKEVRARLASLRKTGLFEVAFVRHPIAWWSSYWRYRMVTGWQPLHEVDSVCCSDEFNRFIANVVEHRPGWCSWLFETFTGPEDDEVDFIVRQENLVEEFIRALDMSGNLSSPAASIARTLPKANVTMGSFETDLELALCGALYLAEERAVRRHYPNDLELSGLPISTPEPSTPA